MPDPVPADAIGAIVAYLLADATVAGLAANRVFGGELPDAEAQAQPRKAIVIKPSGGVSLTAGSNAPHDTGRFDIFAFGETPLEAMSLCAAAGLAMRRIERALHAGVLLHWAKNAGGPIPGREPATDWPRCFQSFQVFHALEAVA